MKLIEIIKKRKKQRLIEESDFVNAINKFSKVDECVICHSKMTSACNSHVVPQFILKNISENGKVAYGMSLSNIEINGINKETGIKNAHTFRLICNECDNKLFKDYETKDNLIGYDSLNEKMKNKILCEMAIKSRLSHISMKYRSIVTKDMVTGGKLAKMEENGEMVFAERVDMEDHFDKINQFVSYLNNDFCPFDIIFNELLDYKTDISTQTIINFNYDLTGKKIFNPSDVSFDNIGHYFYLMILPFEDKTRVIFYIEKERNKCADELIKQFNALSHNDKLRFLFISLIIHDEQFYMSPSLAVKINKNDKKLRKLYIKSEKDLKYTKEISRFYKYNNYLIKG